MCSLNARDMLFSGRVRASEEPYFCRSLKQGKTVLKFFNRIEVDLSRLSS